MNVIFFRKELLLWFGQNKRDLPWRHTREAYKIWVSEIILQQTTVGQGLDYYNQFIETFPDIFCLAASAEQDVLKLWQGLGYYSRARHMHHSARAVVEKHKGIFPDNYEDIISLKGIGPYTAAAVLSFAFNKPYPVIDGNVMRVISRIYGIEMPINSAEGLNCIKEGVASLFDNKNPADFNQALMEFGALHCKVHNPLCEECFVQKDCMAYRKGIQDALPTKIKNKTIRKRHFVYLVPILEEDGVIYTFLKKRIDKDIWHNLYDFLLLECQKIPKPSGLLKSADFKKTFPELNIKPADVEVSGLYIHKLTHQTIFARFFAFKAQHIEKPEFCIKVKINALNDYPLPKLIENYTDTFF